MSLSPEHIKSIARRTLEIEAQALAQLAERISNDFVNALNAVLHSHGRLVVTGIGKSANIAQKLVATFNSTGQPAVFMHAADAIHGDLGNVQKDDVVLCISKSGDSPEIKFVIPLIRSMGNVVIGMTANTSSYLAQHSDFVLHTPIEKEACPNNLAPTTSTTAQLALGDALAVALMECRGFTAEDFARYHPGGALGKKLYIRMGDLLGNNSKPSVSIDTKMPQVLHAISAHRLGAAAVVTNDLAVGIITDGDIRRSIERGDDLHQTTAAQLMSGTPKTIDADELAVNGFHAMESNNITQMIVLKEGRYAGIVHLHDILKEGIF